MRVVYIMIIVSGESSSGRTSDSGSDYPGSNPGSPVFLMVANFFFVTSPLVPLQMLKKLS